jgi:hypothetical protein
MKYEELSKKVDVLVDEVKALRDTFNSNHPQEKGVRYEEGLLYVVIIDEVPYLLVGKDLNGYFNWHSLTGDYPAEYTWDSRYPTGQDALDAVVKNGALHEFRVYSEGIKFFYEAYVKAEIR